MKLGKKKLSLFLTNKEKWLEWVYDDKSSHFFWFCPTHIGLVSRPVDGVGNVSGKCVCDYPGCTNIADKELFPNLVKIVKSVKKEDLVSIDEVFNEKPKRKK